MATKNLKYSLNNFMSQGDDVIEQARKQAKAQKSLQEKLDKLYNTTAPSNKALQEYYEEIAKTAMRLANMAIEDDKDVKSINKNFTKKKKESALDTLKQADLETITGLSIDQFHAKFVNLIQKKVYEPKFTTNKKFIMKPIIEYALRTMGFKGKKIVWAKAQNDVTKWMRDAATPEQKREVEKIALASQLAQAIDQYNRAVNSLNKKIIKDLQDGSLNSFLKYKYDPRIYEDADGSKVLDNPIPSMPLDVDIEGFTEAFDLVPYELLLASNKTTLSDQDQDQIDYVLAGKDEKAASNTDVLKAFLKDKDYSIENYNKLYTDLNFLRIIYHSSNQAWAPETSALMKYLIENGEGALIAQVFKEHDLSVLFKYGKEQQEKISNYSEEQRDAEEKFKKYIMEKFEERLKEYEEQEKKWSRPLSVINRSRKNKTSEETRKKEINRIKEQKKKFENFKNFTYKEEEIDVPDSVKQIYGGK